MRATATQIGTWKYRSTLSFDLVDPLLEVEADAFEERVAALAEELDRKQVSLSLADHRGEAAPRVPGTVGSAREIFSLPRLDREGEYRYARRYALVRERLMRAVERAGLEWQGSEATLASMICRESSCLGESCTRIMNRVPGGKARLLRARCAEFNQVRNAFIEGGLYIVPLVLAKFRHATLSREDLLQEGSASLFRAVDKYDWRKGVRFRTYAEFWINQSFVEAVYNQGQTVRIPSWVQKTTKKIRKAMVREGRRDDVNEVDEAVARELGVDVDKATRIMTGNRRTVSLDANWDTEESGGRQAEVAIDETAADAAVQREEAYLLPRRLEEALSTLPGRERHVLSSRYGLGGGEIRTLQELADEMGVSAERVRQIQNRAIRRLQEPASRKLLMAL